MEFGSDFHRIEYPIGSGLPYGIFNHYVSGRQPLLDIVLSSGYKRIWVPSYYCGESLLILNRSDIKISRYKCLPTDNPDKSVEALPLETDDLLLRLNYFGFHGFHDSSKYPCDVIEDHTHDLIGFWPVRSNAKWCFASIRKSVPTADGGILWSPANSLLPRQHSRTSAVAGSMALRYCAMEAKTEFLNGRQLDKESFLQAFRDTEECFGTFTLSDWSSITNEIISSIDIESWYNLKKANYISLLSELEFRNSTLITGNIESSTPFSLIILFHSKAQRENARSFLIRNNVYPAVLWPDVYNKDSDAIDFSQRMLSIHCDGRYSENDMRILAQILNHVL
jgi:hypothetical protein